jgi:hypothetical protein
LSCPRVGSHIVGYLSSQATTCRSAAAPPARGRCIGQVAADLRQSAGTPFFAGCEACRAAGGLDLTSKSSAASASIRSSKQRDARRRPAAVPLRPRDHDLLRSAGRAASSSEESANHRSLPADRGCPCDPTEAPGCGPVSNCKSRRRAQGT